MGQVFGIFPQPLWFAKIDKQLTVEEFKFIQDQEKVSNTRNECSVNKNILDYESVSSLRVEIEKELSQFVQSVFVPKNPIKVYITQSWVNYNKLGDEHFIHAHPNSFLSGVYYVNAVKGKDSILFENNYSTFKIDTEEFNVYNSSDWKIPVETGNLIIFKSSLYHRVLPVIHDEMRVSISFNTFIRGKIGDDIGAAGLEIF